MASTQQDSNWGVGSALRSLAGRVLGKARLLTDGAIDAAMRQKNVLYAFYDLAVSPATFDFVTFLVRAEAVRKRGGQDLLHVVFVPGYEDGFRRGDLGTYRAVGHGSATRGYMLWRRDNILVPCVSLMPSCTGMTVCGTREEAKWLRETAGTAVFPDGYVVELPKRDYTMGSFFGEELPSVPTLAAPTQAREHVRRWLQARANGRRVVTITLRECRYEPERNSNVDAWTEFARGLDEEYCPVFVLDCEAAFEPQVEAYPRLLFREASWNLQLRQALYELSYLNLAVNNGPSALLYFTHSVRYLVFKMITPSCSATNEEHFHRTGFAVGGQFPFATPVQRLVWDDDDLPVLRREFEAACRRIDEMTQDEELPKL